jgi:hypothetical protein
MTVKFNYRFFADGVLKDEENDITYDQVLDILGPVVWDGEDETSETLRLNEEDFQARVERLAIYGKVGDVAELEQDMSKHLQPGALALGKILGVPIVLRDVVTVASV